MPYSIVPVDQGYKVMSPDGRTFSKKPLSLKRAKKQRLAISLSESKTSGMPITFYM